ncbi:MAG: chemotaxis protein CheW [Gemmatimonadales bacterium]
MTPKRARRDTAARGPASVPEAPVVTAPVDREGLLSFADALGREESAVVVAAPEPELHLVSFQLGREAFAVPITKVREIIRVADITRVPQAPPHIRGVTNLRGRILPVVELRTRLGLSAAVLTSRSRVIVVESRGRVLGILVDAVLRVAKVSAAAVSLPPAEIITARTDFITGVATLQDELLLLLDLDAALLIHEEGGAEPPAAGPV